jgi:ppGpp synthetase/RelA/SpoT-type nucleotidyltranferase
MGPEHYSALRLEHDASETLGAIIDVLQKSGIADEAYAIKARVKTEEKLIEKLYRKRNDKNYELTDITDVIGVRIVSLFREDMIDIFRKLIDVIKHHEVTSENPFLKDQFDEVIIYAQNELDPLAANIKLLSHSLLRGTDVKHGISLEGYSSIHLVSRTEKKVQLESGLIHIPVEIQIRTVFEDAWGEIDHKFKYKESVNILNPTTVSENLKVLKKFSDACSLYADEIRNHAIDKETKPYASFSTYPVDTGDEIHDCLKGLGLSSDILDKYLSLRKDLLKYTDSSTAKPETLKLISAADAFLDLNKAIISMNTLDKSNIEYIDYHLSMHAALCMLATKESKKLRIALDIYKTLSDTYPDNPMVSYRLGQAYVGLRHIDDALRVYSTINLQDLDKQASSSLLSAKEIEHIKEFLPYMHGYVLWRQSTEESGVTNKIQLIKQAIKVTEAGLSRVVDEIQKNKYVNNLLYYRYELAEHDQVNNENTDKLLELIDKIKGENVNYESDIYVLDTLTKAYFALRDYNECISYAEKLLDLSLTSDDKADEIVWMVTKEAHEIRNKAKEKLTRT